MRRTLLSWAVVLTLGLAIAAGPAAAAPPAQFSGTFEKGLAKPWRIVGGKWEVRNGCLEQLDAGMDDPNKAILELADPEDLAAGIVVTARVRIDAWSNDDWARAGVGCGCDRATGYGLNLVFHKGRLEFVHDYVAWGPGCPFPIQVGAWYWIKLAQDGNTLQGKAWADGTAEPAQWMVAWTRTGEPPVGYPALVGSSGNVQAGKSRVSFSECRVAALPTLVASCYLKRATWQETLLASLDALEKQSPAPPTGDQRGLYQERLWRLLRRDFGDPQSLRRMAWEQKDKIWPSDGPPRIDALAANYARAIGGGLDAQGKQIVAGVKTAGDLEPIRAIYYRAREIDEVLARWNDADLASLRRAVEDLAATFGSGYPRGLEFLGRLSAVEQQLAAARPAGQALDREKLSAAIEQFNTLRTEALLANPLLDFDRLLVVRRKDVRDMRPRPSVVGEAANFVGNDVVGFLNGLPINFQGNGYLRLVPMDNEIALLSLRGGQMATLVRPEKPVYVGDLRLNFDGDRLLFSSVGSHERWQIFEVGVDGRGLRQVTRGDEPDVDNYDACYLPNGRILFNSSACFQSVPCERRCDEVANFCIMDADGGNIRRLCFDQDHNFYPSVMADGRVLYLRWEYTDIAHAFTGRLMTMNPDGTQQRSHYATGSFWPNRIFYARPVPGSPSKFVGIVTGHHGTARAGELVLFDVARGRRLAEGAVQRIPGWGRKVEAKMVDNLVDASWPKFLHPYPLSDKYFLVSCQPSPEARWGIYLVDVFDNMLLLREEEGNVLFEPAPVRRSPRPPVVPDRVPAGVRDATVYLSDIYTGEGLKGVPRGTIKRLRIFTYHFNYYGTSGIEDYVGMDGPWDVRRVLGTVPVREDGSAYFTVPANTPLAVQPLDSEGKAVQLMRSWFTAMPGEAVSCVGCHEDANRAPPGHDLRAVGRTSLSAGETTPGKLAHPAIGEPCKIEPWRGPVRGFSWDREVQPVLDRYCVGCHDGQSGQRKAPPDLRRAEPRSMPLSPFPFPPSFYELRRWVRSPGLEGPSVIPIGDYHADTNALVQLLRKGHHGVRLDEEAWDRLVTWIDMNAPAYGTWLEIPTVRDRERYVKQPTEFFNVGMRPLPVREIEHYRQRRIEFLRRYGGVDDDPEAVPASAPVSIAPVVPPTEAAAPPVAVAGWPFAADEARRRQAACGASPTLSVELAPGVKMELVLVPGGDFILGDPAGADNERPAGKATVARPFYIGKFEVTNAQFALFDPRHDSGVEPMLWLKWHPGHLPPLNQPNQPVCRVSWRQACEFCRWLSTKTGKRFDLPSEDQWEWACRAGTDTAFNFGPPGTDAALLANLADSALLNLGRQAAMEKVKPFFAVDPVDDKNMVAAAVGSYRPNAWGLHDMHGNVAEWTASAELPYPYRSDDPRHAAAEGRKVVRGGAWHDPAALARSASRAAYWPWQRVYQVGFRVVCQ